MGSEMCIRDSRRGKASNHIKFDHHTAILAGDGLLSWAFQIIGDSNFISNAEKRSEICFVLAKAIGPFHHQISQFGGLKEE